MSVEQRVYNAWIKYMKEHGPINDEHFSRSWVLAFLEEQWTAVYNTTSQKRPRNEFNGYVYNSAVQAVLDKAISNTSLLQRSTSSYRFIREWP